MTIQELLKQCRDLNVVEQRESSPAYEERVLRVQDLDPWLTVLTEHLGPATKPAGQKADPANLELTAAFGGLWDDQTLFCRVFDEGAVVAMFWPWQDRAHTTLKIVWIPKKDLP